MNVWLITFEQDFLQQRITNSPTKALDICVEHLQHDYPPQFIDMIRQSFLKNQDNFGIVPWCWVERVEIE